MCSFFFCSVTLQVYSPMCLRVILAGNWVLLVFVWGCRFCFSTAHMHIKLLYELDTCRRLRSPNSSLACCLKLPGSITKMVVRPLPSPSPCPITPSWPSSDSVTDGADVMRLSASFKLLNPEGKHTDEVITDFTHHGDRYQSNVIVYHFAAVRYLFRPASWTLHL